MTSAPKLFRLRVLPTGFTQQQELHVCQCQDPKGAMGDVCAQCGGAIPTPDEASSLSYIRAAEAREQERRYLQENG